MQAAAAAAAAMAPAAAVAAAAGMDAAAAVAVRELWSGFWIADSLQVMQGSCWARPQTC
jgi:hypothetical protein